MNSIVYIGLDVDDNSFTATVLDNDTGKSSPMKSRPRFSAFRKKLEPWIKKGYEVRVCYEATYLGASLKREFDTAGIHCDIVAPSLIPKLPSVRVKTDRLDSEWLSQCYAKGLLQVVNVLEEDREDERRMVRARQDTGQMISPLKLKILALCREKGYDYKSETGRKSYWSQVHYEYLRGLLANKKLNSVYRATLESRLFQLESTYNAIKDLDERIHRLAISDIYKERVGALGCIRGLGELTAMILITEIGDINRFVHPKHLVSYGGFDIVEYSSGGKIRKGSITKMGNKRIRCVLVEACQTPANPYALSRTLKQRREHQPLRYIEIGDRCMKRLSKKATRLRLSQKPANKIKVACAREMIGFVWEALRAAQSEPAEYKGVLS